MNIIASGRVEDAVDPPDWVEILVAAEKWGVPPWVVDEGSALWLLRFRALENTRAKKREEQQNG